MSREGLLCGFGNPLLDISSVVDEKFLEKHGLKPDNAILAEEKHIPIYKELVDEHNAEFIAGGSVQNSLRVCQWILQKPNVSNFFGCVGSDDYAKILEKKAREDGVNVHYQITEKEPTGTCAVLITGTKRSLVANLAAANLFTLDHIKKEENFKYLENAEYYYISGFFITVSPQTIMHVANYAADKNRYFMMNLSAPFICEFFKEPLKAVLPYIDFLFGNESEALTFAKHCMDVETEDLKEIAMKISHLPKKNSNINRIVIITQGYLPIIVVHNNILVEYPVEKLEPEQITDTNGAGDAFVGGFLACFIQKKPMDECVKCGIWTAKQIIQRSGCTFEGTPKFIC
uniref:Adenosine kinase n=1 Tax=Culicoides sonorensis TaxID=179676 RepID=A0A336M4V2_CULSO